MSLYWLIISLSWCGWVSLQCVSRPQHSIALDSYDSISPYPTAYTHFYDLPNDIEAFRNTQKTSGPDQFYQRKNDISLTGLEKKRRAERSETVNDCHWMSNLIDIDKTMDLGKEVISPRSPFDEQTYDDDTIEPNASEINIDPMTKKIVSTSGGKGDSHMPYIEHTWMWKRAAYRRDPTMPKRVRFSPWGGKRSGQKNKADKHFVMSPQIVPYLTRLFPNYLPNNEKTNLGLNQFAIYLNKEHPIRVSESSTKFNENRSPIESLFHDFFGVFPNFLKTPERQNPANAHLKKYGKRKIKFNPWGGKRLSPVMNQFGNKVQD